MFKMFNTLMPLVLLKSLSEEDMPITQKTPMNDIINYCTDAIEKQIDKIIVGLQVVGEECLKEAKEHHTYTDRTGNLTASMGYLIAYNGNIRMQNANVKGTEVLMELLPTYSNGIVLIMVAGMEYATYVSARGYNVLDSSEIEAQTLVPQMLRKLKLID